MRTSPDGKGDLDRSGFASHIAYTGPCKPTVLFDGIFEIGGNFACWWHREVMRTSWTKCGSDAFADEVPLVFGRGNPWTTGWISVIVEGTPLGYCKNSGPPGNVGVREGTGFLGKPLMAFIQIGKIILHGVKSRKIFLFRSRLSERWWSGSESRL